MLTNKRFTTGYTYHIRIPYKDTLPSKAELQVLKRSEFYHFHYSHFLSNLKVGPASYPEFVCLSGLLFLLPHFCNMQQHVQQAVNCITRICDSETSRSKFHQFPLHTYHTVSDKNCGGGTTIGLVWLWNCNSHDVISKAINLFRQELRHFQPQRKPVMLLLTPEVRRGWLIQLGLYLVANDTWNCTKKSFDILFLPT